MAEYDREREITEFKEQAATPKLAVFNTAVRNVLGGMTLTDASPTAVMDFLRGAYRPFGIAVSESGDDSRYYSATVIARSLDVYSHSGRPQAQAVAAIIEKLNFDPKGHILIVPYGLVGFSVKYDRYIADAVADWLEHHDYPHDIPHNGFEYHVIYEEPGVPYEYECDFDIDLDLDDFDDGFWDED